MQVSYRVDGVIGVITIARPPVNALDVAMRRMLLHVVRQARDDAGTIGVVVTGNTYVFSAGADIGELDSELALDAPLMSVVLAGIEESSKPFVAAISGACLGAGLELALACHYRLADRGATLGFPEIRLGLLPAAGTQRLSRAVGVGLALKMMLSGQPVDASQAEHLGPVRRYGEGDLLAQAIALAQDSGLRGLLPRLRELPVALPAGREANEYFEAQVEALRSALPAQTRCVAAVRAAVELPFDEGAKREMDLFRELLASPESRALRYALAGQRAAAKASCGVAAASARSVAVIGSGAMGVRIAVCCADAGLPVILLDSKEPALHRAVGAIRSVYDRLVKKGSLSPTRMDERVRRIRPTTSYAAIAEVDLAIEAGIEEMSAKQVVLRKLDEATRPGAVLATNATTPDIEQFAAFTQRPGDVVGLHFCAPADTLRLLEVVRGRMTSDEALAKVQGLARKIGRIGVAIVTCNGLVGRRLFEAYGLQARLLLDMGASPDQIDGALRRFGMAEGPFAAIDRAGAGVAHAIELRLASAQLGRPSSKRPDRVSEQEIAHRCVLALVNEGARLVEEGTVARASDIDVVCLNGYGFPAHRGGPMFHADSIGLSRVLGLMDGLRAAPMGHLWEPAPLLVRGSRMNLRLSDA